MNTQNVQWLVDTHVVDALKAAQEDADKALTQYVDAKRRVAELEALRDLRVEMGAELVGLLKIAPLREPASA